MADVDLFVSRGRLPTRGSADFVSTSSRAGEAITIPSGSRDTVFVAVHSYSGPLWYRVHASRVDRSRNVLSNAVGFSFAPTAGEVSSIRANLLQARRRFFGMTNGRRFIGKLTLSVMPPTGGCDCVGGVCDTCVRSSTGVSVATFSSFPIRPGVTLYRPGGWTSMTMSHEWGHFSLHLLDEYTEHASSPRWTDSWCSASVMASNNNTHRLCTRAAHGASGDTPTHICPNQAGYTPFCFTGPGAVAPVWDYIANAFALEQQTVLPENTDYRDFDWLDAALGPTP